MRKSFTLLFAALLACVGVAKAQTQITDVSQLSNDKAYLITPKASDRGSLSASESDSYLERNTSNDASNTAQQFAFINYDDKFYLYSIAAKKFAFDEGKYIKLVESPIGNHVVLDKGNAAGYFIIKLGGNDLVNVSTGWDHGALADWNTIDDGNQFTIVEAATVDLEDVIALFSNTAKITYNYYIGETLYTQTTVEVGKGADYPAADAVPGYVAVTGVPTGKAEQDGSFNLQCSLKEDFPFSTTEYFGLTVRGGAKWLFANSLKQSLTTTPLTIHNEYQADNYSWIVEGTWHEGFYFKSKKANKYLAAPAEMTNGADVALVGKEEASKFNIDLVNGQYYIRLSGTTNNCVSDFGGSDNKSLKFWDSSANYGDGGSQFAVVSTDPQDLLDAFKSEYTSSVGYVNGYDVEASVIEALTLETVGDFLMDNEVIELTEGEYYIKGVNKAWYASNANGEFKAVEATELNKDYMWSFKATEDEGYKLKSVATEKYVSALVDADATGGGATPTNKEADAAGTYTFTDNGAAKFVIKSDDHAMRTEGNGKINYWRSDVNEWYLVPVAKEPMTIVGARVGDVEIVEGAAEVTSIATIDLIFDRPVAKGEGWATIDGPWGPETLGMEILEAEEGSSEYVVRFFENFGGAYTDAQDYTVNIPAGLIVGADYSYFINPEFTATITIPEASEEPGDPETPSASLNVTNVTVGEEVMEGLVAAATPTDMIVVNFDGKFYLQTVSIVDANGNNASQYFQYMSGLDTGNPALDNSYIFMGANAPAGFYTITMAKASFADYEELGYKVPAEDIVLTVQILGEESKIDAVEADAKAVIYDLAGRRVEKMEKGIYIVNGKKVVIK